MRSGDDFSSSLSLFGIIELGSANSFCYRRRNGGLLSGEGFLKKVLFLGGDRDLFDDYGSGLEFSSRS
jgi:hypothetical protein